MKVGRWKPKLAVAMAATMLATMSAFPLVAMAQSARGIMMYEDTKTGAFYSKPGKNRIPVGRLYLDTEAPPSTTAVQEQVQREVKKHDDELRAEFMANQQTLLQKNAELSSQVAEIKPAWTDYMDNFKNKFRLGTLVYADYRFYSHTTFQPQEMVEVNNPGIGNNEWNSFDVARTYLNFFFFPTDDITARVTPNLYRQTISASNTTSGLGPNSAYSTVADGNLAFRLKYGYLQYSKLFDKLGVDAMKGDTVTFGQQPNPLVDWEEQLFQYRFVTLTPWNYLSLSSSQQGLSVQGPIKFNGLQYVDYDLGVYNNASFHAFENTSTKQGMARVSIYPFGARWRFEGLGLTAFYDYGYGNVTEDTGTPAPLTAAGNSLSITSSKAHSERIAGLIHYDTEWWGLAFEYDQGHNAFSSGNLFSGSAPATAVTLSHGVPIAGRWAANSTLASALLSNGRAAEQGFDAFGHIHIPETPFTLFGMFEWTLPNTHVDENPFDFQRWVAGVSYQYNEFLRFAFDTQNMLYYHHNFAFSHAEANHFAPGAFAATGSVPNSVFRDGHSFWLNAEFNF
jgi:hypothetical protein